MAVTVWSSIQWGLVILRFFSYMITKRRYPLVIKHGNWKSTMNGGFIGKSPIIYIYIHGPCSIAMFHYRRVTLARSSQLNECTTLYEQKKSSDWSYLNCWLGTGMWSLPGRYDHLYLDKSYNHDKSLVLRDTPLSDSCDIICSCHGFELHLNKKRQVLMPKDSQTDLSLIVWNGSWQLPCFGAKHYANCS